MFGMGETHSGFPSDIEDDDGGGSDSDAGFRSGNTSEVNLKSLLGMEREAEKEPTQGRKTWRMEEEFEEAGDAELGLRSAARGSRFGL